MDVFLANGQPSLSVDPLLERLRFATAGTYDVAGELGRGGMAVVYLGKDLKLDRLVAIKVMDPMLTLSQGMAERFLQEARIAARLQHPNIIVVHDIRQEHDLIFFVMAFIEGASLDEFCSVDEPLPIDQARWVLWQSARALAYAHAEGVVHRDVKPANILINLKGEVILGDFGIAKASDGSSLTKSGTSMGTPTYMSPEQFTSRPAGPAADQYALGVTAYQLLTGRPPFKGELFYLIAAHGNEAPVPLRERRPDCPPFLANTVMRMLAKEPDDRFPSLEDAAAVFGANMPMDGGPGRRAVAVRAAGLQLVRERNVPALSARTPRSPIVVSGHTPTPTPRPAQLIVALTPSAATVYSGGTLDLNVRVTTPSGDPIANASMLWSSSDPAVATVGGDGRVRGVAPGSTFIQVTVNGNVSVATITVELAPLTRLVLEPSEISTKVADRTSISATVFDATGAPRPDVSVSWSVEPGDGGPVRITSSGVLEAIAPGDALVTASVGPLAADVPVRVARRPVERVKLSPVLGPLELGAAVRLSVACYDDLGGVVSAPVQWQSSAPTIVHVDANGTALAIAVGRVTVEASVGSVTDSIELVSIESPIGSLMFAESTYSLEVGETIPLPLMALDVNGAPRSVNDVEFLVDKLERLDIDPDAMTVTARAPGDVRVIAGPAGTLSLTSPSAIRATCRIEVRPVLAVQLDVQPTRLALNAGETGRVQVTPRDMRGRPLTERRIDAMILDASLADVTVESGQSLLVKATAGGATALRVSVTNEDGSVVMSDLPLQIAAAVAAAVADRGAVLDTASRATSSTTPTASRSRSRVGLAVAGVGGVALMAFLLRGSDQSPADTSPPVELASPAAPSTSDATPAPQTPAVVEQAAAPAVAAAQTPNAPAVSSPAPVSAPVSAPAPAPAPVPAPASAPAPARSAALAATRTPAAATARPSVAAASPVERTPVAVVTPSPSPVSQAPAVSVPAAPPPLRDTVSPIPARAVPDVRTPEPVAEASVAAPVAPNAGELRRIADSLATSVRRRATSTAELAAFFKDGDEHTVKLTEAPSVLSDTRGTVRARVDLKLEKFDGAGRPVSRALQIIIDVVRRSSGLSVQLVTIAPLRRTR